MRLILLSLILLLLNDGISAQSKYFVFLKDKGNTASLSKISAEKIRSLLTPQTIERRKRIFGENNYLRFEDMPLDSGYVDRLKSLGVEIVHQLKWFNAVSCYIDEDKLEEIKALDFVDSIRKVKIYKFRYPGENNPLSGNAVAKTQFNEDYGYSLKQNLLSHIPYLHDLGITGKGVLIGLLDTGFRYKDNPALKFVNVIGEKDFIQNDEITENEPSKGDASNQDRHGTAVLSIIAGYAPGNLIGPAYEASYLLAKTEYVPSETHLEEDNYAAGVEWLEANGAFIISSSLGYNIFDKPESSYLFEDMNGKTTIVARALNKAFEFGVATFTSAGNEGATSWGAEFGDNLYGKIVSPADAFNVIAVGAVDDSNRVVDFSSRGPTSDGRVKPELVAMGSGVSYATSNGYFTGNGTSFSTPITAGIAALLKSFYPHLTNAQIRYIMLESGDNASSPNNERGWGLISALRAVNFPNLNRISNSYILNKTFFDTLDYEISNPEIHYSTDNMNFSVYKLTKNEKNVYQFQLPFLSDGEVLSFYYTYEANGQQIRVPSSAYYKIQYGKLNVGYNLNVEERTLPDEFTLLQNYPNPFNAETNIEFALPEAANIDLSIYNLLGQRIYTLYSGELYEGWHKFKWYGTSNNNLHVSSGLYFCRLLVDGKQKVIKIVLMR
ncbi:subtilisin-like serine protease [Melioribacter roseus P3M-2]|uniref:Subtilisin-like serine protease n=1 Tax=Melioribacter roseus (strain DSM 23840 / JCM 17771 / VKM B-2668 / P3M-2) TaxID=1191523 RepID=I7A1S0_MELRP|nr:S8 family serine peptidase [Melioribacter roseus]AFN75188.1 subtilisin-like serine protease [Melioribacter roseus P3M-2]